MLSLPHLVVLFVLALVIFGPQKLPELARMLGKATAEFRKMTTDFRYALEDEVRELERQTRIRDEEVAAAANAVTLPPIPPEFVMPRESVPHDGAINPVADPTLQADSPAQASAPTPEKPVSVPLEKPSDDNTAV